MSYAERLLLHYARSFPISRGKLRVVDALWKTVAGKGRQRTAKLIYSDFRMHCRIDEMIQRQIYFFGTYFASRRMIAAWQAKAANASVILDVGANVGIFSLAALSANPRAQVHSFEPTPDIARQLQQSVTLNSLEGRLHVHPVALSDHGGWGHLVNCDGGGDNGGMNFLVSAPRNEGDSQPVETTTLDAVVQSEGISQIDLMKIDVQGHEAAVLRGARACLENKQIRSILIELNWGSDPSTCVATESIDLLCAHGFMFQDPLSLRPPQSAGQWMRDLNDVMAVSP
jgi:FkbM family methyltransferase